MSGARRYMMAGGGATGPSFFGHYTMYREFCAEDPNWTDPGDGNVLTSVRDNGTAAEDLSVTGSATKPTYHDSLIGGQPGFDFAATSSTGSDGGTLHTGIGTIAADFTVVAVGRFDNESWFQHLIDSDGASSEQRCVIGHGAAYTWRGYNQSALSVDVGAADAADHVFVLHVSTDDLRLYVDGTLVGTDSSGTAQPVQGFTIGGDWEQNSELLNGACSYAAMYEGDLTAATGYADWLQEIKDHYGIA